MMKLLFGDISCTKVHVCQMKYFNLIYLIYGTKVHVCQMKYLNLVWKYVKSMVVFAKVFCFLINFYVRRDYKYHVWMLYVFHEFNLLVIINMIAAISVFKTSGWINGWQVWCMD